MDRRDFTRLCGGLVAGAASLHSKANTATQSWSRSRLLDEHDQPLLAANLTAGESRIFSYPYACTPCFLLRLDPTIGQGDEAWTGGVGPEQSIVAFSAICTHKLSHPARSISHLNYRHDTVRFFRDGERVERRQIISCCSEHSMYDPARGAEVLNGPAPMPLAAIALEIDTSGALIATGSLGADQYDRFLDKFAFRLALEYGVSDVRAFVGDTTVAIPAADFSQQQIRC